MVAHIVDHVIEQGATFDFDFTWADTVTGVDANGTTTSTMAPKDLTGCTARMQVRCGYGKPVMLEATTENGRITLGGTAGTVRIDLDATVTDAAPIRTLPSGKKVLARRGRYDLEIAWPDGRVDRVLEGRIAFRANITRPVPTPATPATTPATTPVALPAGTP